MRELANMVSVSPIDILDKLADTIQDVVILTDTKCRIQSIFGHWFEGYGFSKKELIGKTGIDVFGKDGKIHYNNCLKIVKGQQPYIEYKWIYKTDNNKVHYIVKASEVVDSEGVMQGALFIFHDSTALEYAKDELNKNRNRYRIVTELVTDFSWEFKRKTRDKWEVDWVSDKFNELTGYSKDDFSKYQYEDIVHPEDQKVIAKANADCILGKDSQYEVRIQHKDGHYLWLRKYDHPELDDAGELVRVYCAVQDISEIRQKEEDLRRYAFMINSIQDFVALINKDFYYEAVNDSYCSHSGMDRDRIVGQSIEALWGKANFDSVRPFLTRALSGQPQRYESFFSFFNSQPQHFEVYAYPYSQNEKEITHVIVITHNINQRKIAENLLMEREKQLQLAFENTSLGVALLDVQGNFLRYNKRLSDIIGYPEDFFTGKNINRLSEEDNYAISNTDFKNIIMEKNLSTTFERSFKHKNGETLTLFIRAGLVLVDEDPSFVVLGVEDITKQRRDLVQMKALVSAIQQSVEGIIITEAMGRISFANDTFLHMIGFKKEEFLGRNIANFYGDNLSFDELDVYTQTLLDKRIFRGTWAYRHKDGSNKEIDLTVSPVFDEKMQVHSFIAVARDMTQEKLMLERLHQVQKMEAIGTLAAGIAHDFNNILTAMLGYAELIGDDLKPDSITYSNQQEILRSGLRARDLVESILAFSRQSVANKRVIDLNLVIGESLKLLRSTLPKSIELVIEMPAGPNYIEADPVHIHQIMLNLCTNAYQAMQGKNGVIKISIQQIESISSLNQAALVLDPGTYFVICIKDQGHGIEPTVLHRVFEPFYTTKQPGQGTGLGLSIVHGIVKDLKGEVLVESEVGVGSTFSVYLPCSSKLPTEQFESNSSPTGKCEQILYVDDEDSILHMEEQILRRLGYQVTTSNCSLKALEWIKEDPLRFDLLITDMTMAKMNGDQLAINALKLNPDLPIIMITGFNELISPERAKAIGIKEFLLKPTTKNVLAVVIRRVLEERGNK